MTNLEQIIKEQVSLLVMEAENITNIEKIINKINSTELTKNIEYECQINGDYEGLISLLKDFKVKEMNNFENIEENPIEFLINEFGYNSQNLYQMVGDFAKQEYIDYIQDKLSFTENGELKVYRSVYVDDINQDIDNLINYDNNGIGEFWTYDLNNLQNSNWLNSYGSNSNNTNKIFFVASTNSFDLLGSIVLFIYELEQHKYGEGECEIRPKSITLHQILDDNLNVIHNFSQGIKIEI